MEKITFKSYENTHEFELVDSVPIGYRIWNIGKNMIDGYLPLVQVGGYDGCQVNTRTMKAVKIDGAQTILSAVGYGPETVGEMEKHIEKYEKSRPMEVELMKKALPIMRKIKGL
jgi:hypothetical protein